MASKNVAPLLRWDVGSPVYSVDVSHDGMRVASGSYDRLVRIWDVHTGALVLGPLKGHTGCVQSVAWSHDDSHLVSGSEDKTIRMWDTHTGTPVGQPLIGHTNWVFWVAFSSDNTRIVSSSGDRTIRIWDARTGAPIGEPLRGHTDQVYSAVFSPDSTHIASGSADNTIRTWNALTGAPLGEPLRGHTIPVSSASFSHDSTRIISSSWDGTIGIWDIGTGTLIGEPLRGHTDHINSAAISRDGARIASGSNDMTVRVWDALSGNRIGQPFRGHTNSILSVVFTPDSNRIISGALDGVICIWEARYVPFSFDLVTSDMSSQEMFECLVQHGCKDLTSYTTLDVTDSAIVASGGFGDVRRMTMGNGATVALKTLRLHVLLKDDTKAVKRAVREVYVWSRLHHVNVQELMGLIVFQGGLGMVSPWMENGNLQEYIAKNPNVERYPWCLQLASGVSYLHSVNMVHGDLKAANVLVSQDGILKISDFDYAILFGGELHFSTTTRPGGGTPRWMAPELYQPEPEDDQEVQETQPNPTRTVKTDIYALGMTILETITGTVPYSEYRTDLGIYRAIDRKQPPRRPRVLVGPDPRANPMWDLLLKCWDYDPSARPDAPSVLARLESFATKS